MIRSHVSLIQYLQSCCYCCMPFASHDPLILCLLHHVILHIIRSIEHVTCHVILSFCSSGVAFSGGGQNHTSSGLMTSAISLGLLGGLLAETRRSNEVGVAIQGEGYVLIT